MTEARLLRTEARTCASSLRLALSRKEWRGSVGQLAGTGSGSSIDFQDHRPYMPGDDPRHIDWAATARTDQAIMKLYQEEVSPRMDLIIDTSASMSVTADKGVMSSLLTFFCIESALALSASLKIHLLVEGSVETVTPEKVFHPEWTLPVTTGETLIPDLHQVPLRPGSLRVWVTDTLFAVDPKTVLRPLVREGGRGMLLAPFDPTEEHPDWSGNLRMIDAETQRIRRQRVTPDLLRRYEDAYHRHVAGWRETSRTLGVAMARIPAGRPLVEALQTEALLQGVVEPWA